MRISFSCEHCGRRYRVDETRVGQRATCKDCGHPLRVPVPGPVVDESPSGQPVYRHHAREREFEPAHGEDDTIEAVSQHLEQHLGPVSQVWHELVSDMVHIDVHEVAPTERHPFWTLVTSGMSDRPMSVPNECPELALAELMICLPPDWKLSAAAFREEDNYWPVRLLKSLARLPHEFETWLGPGHTVPNGGDTPAPYSAGTKFECALLLPPLIALPSELGRLPLDDGRVINFYSVWPLHPGEVRLKLNRGLEALLDRFARNRVTEVVDLTRPDTAARPWWPFWKTAR